MFPWLKRIECGLFVRSREAPPPWGPVLRALRYPVALLRDWFAGELNVRAMSLAYTTLLSIVPLIAFSISILKGLGAHVNLAGLLYDFFRPIGGAAPELTKHVMQFVKNLRGDVLGSIGFGFLIYAVVTTMHKIEASFNFVWRIARPRSLALRFGEYLSALIVGPVLLAAAFGVLASAHDSPVAHWLGTMLPLHWTFSLLGKLTPYLVVTLVFTIMYVLVPNTRVKATAAITGGVAAGMLWALIGKAFTAFIGYSSQMIAIYTSFAVVLTTLIWVYVSWLILLIGAQLSFYLQNPQYLRHGRKIVDLTGASRERVAFAVMYLLGREQAGLRGHWTASLLAEKLDLPGSALEGVLDALERAGLLVATDQGTLAMGRDIHAIELAQVLDAVRAPTPDLTSMNTHGPEATDALMRRMEAALHESLRGLTLSDLIDGS